MKYKELALDKIERLENLVKTLESHLNRNDVGNSRETLTLVQSQIEVLRNQISIEQN